MNNYRYKEALNTSQTAMEMLRQVGDRDGEIHATNVNAIVQSYLGNFEEAERGYLKMLNLAEEIGDDTGLRWGVNNLMGVYNFTCEHEKGLRIAEAQAEKAEQQGNELVLFNHLGAMQFQLYQMGQIRKAQEIVLKNLASIEEFFDPSYKSIVQFYMSEISYRLGDEKEGQRYFIEGEQLLAAHDFPPNREFNIWDGLLTVCLLKPGIKPLTEIQQKLEVLIHTFREGGHLEELADGLYSISRLHLALAEEDPAHIERALDALQEAEEIKKTIRPANMLIGHQLYLHARAHRLAGQDERADDYLQQAYNWLMACAEKITTLEYRKSYLENVPENVAIQRDYQDRFGEERTAS
jgi:tetratricopeptide (TPR) repeat protein